MPLATDCAVSLPESTFSDHYRTCTLGCRTHLLRRKSSHHLPDQNCSFPIQGSRNGYELMNVWSCGFNNWILTFIANSMCLISTFGVDNPWVWMCDVMLLSHSFCSSFARGCSCSAKNVRTSLSVKSQQNYE